MPVTRVTQYQVEKLAKLNAANAKETAAFKAAQLAKESWPASRLLALKRALKYADRLAREIERGVKRGDLKAHGIPGFGQGAT